MYVRAMRVIAVDDTLSASSHSSVLICARGVSGPPPGNFVISPLEQCNLGQYYYMYMIILKRKYDMQTSMGTSILFFFKYLRKF